jgi:putative flippase GtrA
MIQYTIGIYQKYKELVNYLIVGVLTTLVSWATYYVCVEWMLNPDIYWQLQVAVLLRWVSGVIFAYFTNRKYVFESKNKNIWKEATQFTSSRLLTLFMDMFVIQIGGLIHLD